MTTKGAVIKHFEGKISYAHRAENFIKGAVPCLCWSLHGHNATLIVEVSGEVNPTTGMSVVFDDIKQVVNKLIIDKWDHAFLYNRSDVGSRSMVDALKIDYMKVAGKIPTEEEIRVVGFDHTTSVENLTAHIFDVLSKEFAKAGAKLELVTFMETETSGYTIRATDDITQVINDAIVKAGPKKLK